MHNAILIIFSAISLTKFSQLCHQAASYQFLQKSLALRKSETIKLIQKPLLWYSWLTWTWSPTQIHHTTTKSQSYPPPHPFARFIEINPFLVKEHKKSTSLRCKKSTLLILSQLYCANDSRVQATLYVRS